MTQILDTITLTNGQQLKNRVVMSPMTTQCAYFDGSIPQELIDYYASRSGNAGAVIVESCFVDNFGRGFYGAVGIDTDDKIEGLAKLATAIQAKGSKAIVQIYHAGRMAWPEMNEGKNPISASAIAALRPNAPVPTEMTHQEILEMIQKFANGVRRAIKAGFDGVEIHGANTFLIQQFFSPHSNRRTDAWGGTREKRAKFAIEVVKAAQQVIAEENAKDFILGYRFSPEELEEPGIRFEDTMYLLNTLADFNLDYVHFSMGIYSRTSICDTNDTELLIQKYHAQKSEQLAKIPVIGVGGILQKVDAEDALQLGYDIVAVAKGFLIEPDWVTAMQEKTVKAYVDVNDREKLLIPQPLWAFMDDTFRLVKDVAAEEAKEKRLQELMSKDLSFTPGQYHVLAKGHNNHW